MELEPKFCDVIAERYIKLKGTCDDVILVRDGKEIGYNEVERST